MKRIAILGATGSIGRQALDVACQNADRCVVVGLAAGRDIAGLMMQALPTKVRWLALESAPDSADALQTLKEFAPAAEIRVGAGSTAWLAKECEADIVVNGVVGAAGLAPSLAALARGARLALANKETLVIAGSLVREALARGGELIPIDSEHSAALECLGGRPSSDVARMILTASGGALRDHADWRQASREEVLAHPVWKMGQRITVDSALLFNKGLELIEARWLFDVDPANIEAVIHPQTLVHALVSFRDGSMMAQAAFPDMRIPIQLALSWPDRWQGFQAKPPRPADLAGLTFDPIVRGRYPAFDLAVEAGRLGGTAPCVVNAADEVAVAAFLDGRIPLGKVPEIIARVLDQHDVAEVTSVRQLAEVDLWARDVARGQAVAA